MSNINTLRDLVFVGGPPGVGKSTVMRSYALWRGETQQFGAGDLIRDVRAGLHPSRYEIPIKHAIEKKEMVPPEVFGGMVLEELQRADEGISLSLVNGFPHSWADWEIFADRVKETNIRMVGSVALTATADICVSRMLERGVREGEQVRLLANEQSREFFIRRYEEYCMRRDLINDIFLQSNIPIIEFDASGNESDVVGALHNSIQLLKKENDDAR